MAGLGSKQGEHVFNDIGAIGSETVTRLRAAIPADATPGERLRIAEMLARLDQDARTFSAGRDLRSFGRAAGGSGDAGNAASYGLFAQSTRQAIDGMVKGDARSFEMSRQQLYDNLAQLERATVDEAARASVLRELPRNQVGGAQQWFAEVAQQGRQLYARMIAAAELVGRSGTARATALRSVQTASVAARPKIRLRALGPLNILGTIIGYFADAKDAKDPAAVRAYADAVLRGEMPLESLYLSPLWEPVVDELRRRALEA